MCPIKLLPQRNRMAVEPRKRGRPKNPLAEHRRVAVDLRTYLSDPGMRTGQVLPSLREIADRLKSTLSATRQAVDLLKQEGRIALNARKRMVISRAGVPTMDGRDLVLIVTAVPMESPWTEYTGPLYSGVIQGVADIGAPMLIAHEHGMQTAMPVGFLDYSLRGIILLGHFKPDIFRAYERLPVPVVIADTPVIDRKIHSVTVDNAAAMKEAVLRLAQMGHRRIGFVRYVLFSLREVDPDSVERQQGFVEGCKEANLPFTNDWIFNALGTGKPNPQTLRRLVGPGSRFTAVVAADGYGANLVVRAAEQFERKIPRDLSLVTMAGISERKFTGPRVDFTALGRLAAPLLNEPKSPVIRRRVATEWADCGTAQPLTT